MILIKPDVVFKISCHSCGNAPVIITGSFFQGIHILAECLCSSCNFKFFHTLPTGHAIQFSISLSYHEKQVINLTPENQWLAIPLQDSFNNRKSVSVQLTQSREIQGNPIILNCLDTCFGHLYSKLWNAQTLLKRYPKNDIIVILPVKFSWMVPKEVSEIWMVDSSLADCRFFLDGLDEWIKNQLARFESVQLSQAYIHLDHHAYLDLEGITGQKRFDLNQFQFLPVTITFVLREDRFWHGSKMFDFLYRLSVKFNFQKLVKPLFLRRQRILVYKTIKAIRKSLSDVRFSVTGLGNTLSFNTSITDLRATDILIETEKSWNTLYSQSHIVIGVHGSHMLIPTSLAAGFINLLPEYKIDHIVEDTVLPYPNRMLQFMGRFLDEFANTSLVAAHAVSIVKCFHMVWSNSQRSPEGE